MRCHLTFDSFCPWHVKLTPPPFQERFQSNRSFIKVPGMVSGEINSDRVKGLYHNPVCKHTINSISCALWVIKWEIFKLLKELRVQLLKWDTIQIDKDPLSCVSKPQAALLWWKIQLFRHFCLDNYWWLHWSKRTDSSTGWNRIVVGQMVSRHKGHNLDLHRHLSGMQTTANDSILCQNN